MITIFSKGVTTEGFTSEKILVKGYIVSDRSTVLRSQRVTSQLTSAMFIKKKLPGFGAESAEAAN